MTYDRINDQNDNNENNNYEVKRLILDKIREYDRIILSRHIRPDGDAVGSTLGLARIISATYPGKDVRVVNSDYAEYTAFLGCESGQPDDNFYASALVIVLDTATTDRISNKRWDRGCEVIKIDHHIDVAPYGDIAWVEDQRCATCEMIADFYMTFSEELTLTREAATAIYAGMVTDSGRFRFRSVSPATLRCAAAMLEAGVNTDELFAELYLEDLDALKLRAFVYDRIKMTEHGVAYIYIDREIKERFSLSDEEASATVSCLDSIKGSPIWIAFIDNSDGETIRVRLRSRFVTIDKLANKYRGGGHDTASGATLYSPDEIELLLQDADALLCDFKEKNRGVK